MADTTTTATTDGVEIVKEPETLAENVTTPDASDAPGDVVVPSNVIDGLFEEKRAAAEEAAKKAAEMDKAGQETPAAVDEAPAKKGRGSKPPKEKTGKEPGAENPEAKKRGGKSADTAGGTGGSPEKEESAPKSGVDMGRDFLRRSHVLVVCGNEIDEVVKNDIAVAGRLGITATTLDGILTVKTQGRDKDND